MPLSYTAFQGGKSSGPHLHGNSLVSPASNADSAFFTMDLVAKSLLRVEVMDILGKMTRTSEIVPFGYNKK